MDEERLSIELDLSMDDERLSMDEDLSMEEDLSTELLLFAWCGATLPSASEEVDSPKAPVAITTSDDATRRRRRG
jgi:hypothetical protein